MVPESIQLWPGITLMFWNATNITKTHLDSRDWSWSLVLPFGNFTIGTVDLPYLNTNVYPERGDIYLLCSNKIYHNVISSEKEKRQVLVFTNHKSVVQQFIDVSIPEKYENCTMQETAKM